MSMLRGLQKQKNSSSICIGCSFLAFKRKNGNVFLVHSRALEYNKLSFFICLKAIIRKTANLLKGRSAKPEGTKVRKLDHVSRLPLFPYHHNIWKRCLNRRDSDTFYTI